jgi:hypothetical protein
LADSRASTDKTGDWYHLTNIASGETGWVAGAYVKPIDPADATPLKKLGALGSSPASLWIAPVSFASSILSIIAALFTIPIETNKLLRKRARTTARPQSMPANVLAFPSSPAKERPQVIFGTSGGAPWLYRPKSYRQGGGAQSA